MALVKCPKCGKMVWEGVEECPNCGHNIQRYCKYVANLSGTSSDEKYQKNITKETSPITVKCPICGSTNIKKITLTKKVIKTAAFGVLGAMDDAGKTWICNNCGSKF